jgi:3-hydroxymyristoyl/3-hydroxydecanoyl-(acyl carrier protein) dehydratase
MSPKEIFEKVVLETRLPHRFENILLESCEVNSASLESKFQATLAPEDPEGRGLFLKQGSSGTWEVMTPILVEMMALGAIASAGDIPEGKNAFFASISNFKREGIFVAGDLLEGSTVFQGERGGLFRYAGKTACGAATAEAKLMAVYVDKDGGSAGPVQTSSELPPLEPGVSIPHPDYKPREMFLLDRLRYYAADPGVIVCSYTYPPDHPLTRGHFPGAPVMMGVSQWLMLEDACYVFARELGRKEKYTMECDADIVKADGSPVCEIRKAVVDIYSGCPGIKDQADLVATKKITFKGAVKPGEELLIHLCVSGIVTPG